MLENYEMGETVHSLTIYSCRTRKKKRAKGARSTQGCGGGFRTFRALVQLSQDSIPAFHGRIKIQEHRGL